MDYFGSASKQVRVQETWANCTTEVTTNQNFSKALEQTHALRVQLQSKETVMKLGICLPLYHPVGTYNKHAVLHKIVGHEIYFLLLLRWLQVWA